MRESKTERKKYLYNNLTLYLSYQKRVARGNILFLNLQIRNRTETYWYRSLDGVSWLPATEENGMPLYHLFIALYAVFCDSGEGSNILELKNEFVTYNFDSTAGFHSFNLTECKISMHSLVLKNLKIWIISWTMVWVQLMMGDLIHFHIFSINFGFPWKNVYDFSV